MNQLNWNLTNDLCARLKRHQIKTENMHDIELHGRLTRVVGFVLEAYGCRLPIGARAEIIGQDQHPYEAEVVGFTENKTFLMTLERTQGLAPGASVIPKEDSRSIGVGPSLLGRIVDGMGRPLDNKGSIEYETQYSLLGEVINPLDRAVIREPLDVGIRSINSLFSIGRGQRLGLFAGSGIGKSVLMGMMAQFTEAEVIVVGLIGERGREVKEFIEENLGVGLKRAVVVATPADTSPLMRLQGAQLATTYAEYFRDKGKKVLLLLDSLTRYAQAQRELGLSIGEPPATKGYTPSVFAKLPQLVERAGNSRDGVGSITAFYTVLAEGDDAQDPVVDAARAILDGHIMLSRRLAEEGHYPAVDLESSISRVMPSITTKEHQKFAQRLRYFYSRYQQNKDLITVGAYNKGSDPELDRIISLMPKIREFLQQDVDTKSMFQESNEALKKLIQQMTKDDKS